MAAPRLIDRVKETVTTVGNGSYTVGATPATGYASVPNSFGDGDTGIFGVEDGLGGYEIFVGTYTSPSTLARTSIIKSSNSNLAVVWGAGNKTLACVMSADRADLVRMKHNLAGGAAPTANDDANDGYHIGSIWIYGTNVYVCTTETAAAAVWQRLSMVGAGTNSVLIGSSATAAGADGVAVGTSASASGATATAVGKSTVASAADASAFGSSASAAASASVAIGKSASVNATGTNSVAIGNTAAVAAAATGAVAVGYAANATAPNAIALGDSDAVRNAVGLGVDAPWKWTVTHGAQNAAGTAVAKNHEVTMVATTTNATPGKLALGADATTYGYNALSVKNALAVHGQVLAISAAASKLVEVKFLMRRFAAGNVALVGTPTVTTLFDESTASTWVVGVTADTTNQTFQIDITGEASVNIAWAGVFRCTVIENTIP